MKFGRNHTKLILLIAYSVIAFIGPLYLGAAYSPWFVVVLSGLFAFCYGVIADGRAFVSLAAVFIVTFVFPIIVLIAIALTVYGTWTKAINVLISSFTTYYSFWGLEMFFPLLVACFGAFVAYSRLSSLELNKDG